MCEEAGMLAICMARARGVERETGRQGGEVSKGQSGKGFGCLVKGLDHYPGCAAESQEKDVVICCHRTCVLGGSLAAL